MRDPTKGYYRSGSDAPELWDPYFVEACLELDKLYPETPLLGFVNGAFATKLPKSIIKKLKVKAKRVNHLLKVS